MPFAVALYRLILRTLARILQIPAAAILHADIARGTLFQISLRTKDGGINLPDPVILAPAAFLGSLADSLPVLSLDSFLQPYLSDPDSWLASSSPTLRDAHLYFHRITSLRPNTLASPHETAITTLLVDHAGHPSLALLHSVAHKHAQCVFASEIFKDRLIQAFEPPFATSEITRARYRHSAVPGAQGLFNLYCILPDVYLTNFQFQFLVCQRVGIPLPFLATPPPNCCHPNCPLYPPSSPFPPALREVSALALHFAGCGALGIRTSRHNSLVQIIGEAARREMSMVPDYRRATSSSTTSGNNIDLVLESFHLQPPAVGIDVTVSHPLLPTYSRFAAGDALRMFLDREKAKDAHHRAGCIDQGKSFLPIVFSTLGGVSPRAREFLDYLFRRAHAIEMEAGGTGLCTIRRRQLFYDSLAATVTRGCATAAIRLGSPPHPCDPGGAPGQ